MKLSLKLILAFSILAISIFITSYISYNNSTRIIQETVVENYVGLAQEILDKIDRTIQRRLEQIQAYAKNLAFEDLLLQPNGHFSSAEMQSDDSARESIQSIINERDKEWVSVPRETITPFMRELINNKLSDKLRNEIELKKFYTEKYGYPVFSEIFITNKYGANAAQTQKTSDYYQADEEWWQKSKENGFYVSDVDYDKSSQVYSLDICVRYDDEAGNFMGVIKASLNIQGINEILKGLEPKAGSENVDPRYDKVKTREFKLITKDGRIIYSTEKVAFFENIRNRLPKHIIHTPKAHWSLNYSIGEGDDLNESDELFVHAHSKGHKDFKGFGWILIVEHEVKEILAPVINLRHTLLAISFFVSALAILVGLFMAHYISTPLAMLSDAAAKIGTGDFDTKIKIKSKDEIGVLADAFNKMVLKLKEKTTSVERLNAERIKAIKNETLAKKTLESEKKIQIANISMMESLLETKTKLEEQTAELERSRKAVLNMMDDLKDEQQQAIELREQAETASKSKSEFLANMSHEIRTPMNAIVGFADLLKTTSLTEKQTDYVNTVMSSGKVLLDLINDILDLSKVEAGAIVLEQIDFNLENFVEDVFNVIRYRTSTHSEEDNVELYFDIEEGLPLDFEGDPSRIRQILINLFSNAMKFTKKGEVGLHVKKEKTLEDEMMLLRFTVKDTGIGIPEDKKKLIFESFAQADTSTTREYGGTGLGLAICQRLVKLMGGDIWVESKEGEGSQFIFTVKLKKRPRVVEKNIHPVSDDYLKNKKVLIIDDSPLTRKILTSFCRKFEMNSTELTSAKDTFDWFSEKKDKEDELPDILFVDIIMPGMKGNELMQKLKENPSYDKIKIIAMSSDLQLGASLDAQKIGFNAFLPKPLTNTVLLNTLKTVLGDKRTGDKQIVTRHMAEELSLKDVKVLVAEDKMSNQKLIKIYLDMFGCISEMANNGQEAIEKMKSCSYDICLMDLQMPVMGGLEASEIIRRDVNKDIPIIALTAAAMKEDEEKALSSGMNDFLTKPIDRKMLKEQILKWVKGQNRQG